MASESAPRILVQCPCGVKLKVPANAEGRKVRCPQCGVSFIAAQSPPNPRSREAPPSGDSLLDELARAELSAPALKRPGGVMAVHCPNCSQSIPGGSLLCVSCGYNRDTGRITKVASVRATHATAVSKKLSKESGAFALGCLLSGIGALIGAALWLVVAAVTQREGGWIAFALGGLAGGGMRLGSRSLSARTGVTAALIGFLGITVAKLAVFGFVMYSIVVGDTSNIQMLRLHLQLATTEQILAQRGASTPKERESEWESAYKKAGEQVAALSDAEVTRHVDELKEKNERQAALFDPTGSKRWRLARHRADRRAEREGLDPHGRARANCEREEFERTETLTDENLRTELEALDQWEQSGKWSDEDYVRDRLTYRFIDETVARQAAVGRGYEFPLPHDVWNDLLQQCKSRAEDMTPAARKDRLLQMERQELEVEFRERLVDHRSEMRAMELGLAYDDPQRNQLDDPISKEVTDLSGEKLDAEIAKLDDWENGGMNADPTYVRNRLIYDIINEDHENENRALAESLSPGGGNAKLSVSQPSPADWKRLYEAAVAKVDAIPVQEHAQQLKELQEKQSEEWQRQAEIRRLEADNEAREQLQESAGALLKAFLIDMLRPVNILCLFLALGTAYKIAAGL